MVDRVQEVESPGWKEYLQRAASYDDDRGQRLRRSERRAWRVAAAAVGLLILSWAALMGLMPLKVVMPPPVILVDRTTGAVEVMTSLNNHQQVRAEDAERKYWLATYVRHREGYTWNDRAESYAVVSAMSEKLEQERYANDVAGSNPRSPQAELGENGMIEIRVVSVALGSTPEASANIRFERIVRDRRGTTQPTQYRVATIGYRFVDEPIKERDRLLNPRGFRVMTYRADTEVTR